MKLNATLAVSAVALLAACGGGSSGTSNAPTLTRTFASEVATPSLALAEGRTLTTQSSQISSLEADYVNTRTTPTSETVKLFLNSDNELSMDVNGTIYAFRPSDRFVETDGKVYGYNVSGQLDEDGNRRFYALFSASGEIDPIKSGENDDKVHIWRYTDVTNDTTTEISSGDLSPDSPPIFRRVRGLISGATRRAFPAPSLP